jgi:hypothetical protein
LATFNIAKYVAIDKETRDNEEDVYTDKSPGYPLRP